ncbi:hypothetical protein EOM86_06015 [Candidatus Nomurabacteria bacterium]|nr:hypothetical protein [Candidatus Nomurabacteria bacterium]
MGQNDIKVEGAAAPVKAAKNSEKYDAERACDMLGADAPTKFCISRKFKGERTLDEWRGILKSCL